MELGALQIHVDDGQNIPIEGVEVTFDGETKITDAKGIAFFDNLKLGAYDVRIFKEAGGV